MLKNGDHRRLYIDLGQTSRFKSERKLKKMSMGSHFLTRLVICPCTVDNRAL